MSKLYGLIASLSLVLCCQTMNAQTASVRQLGIEEMYQIAEEQSNQLAVDHTAITAAREGVAAAKAQKLPELSASLSGSYLGNGYLMDRDFTNGMKADMPHWGNNFALQATQVLYAGGALNASVEMAKLQEQMAQLDMAKNRQEIRFLLTGYYLNLCKLTNQATVLEKNIELTQLVIDNMQARHDQGTVLKNDITRYELQKENLALQLTKVNDTKATINYQLATTLHLPEGTMIQPDTTLLQQSIEPMTELYWQNQAEGNSISLQQTQKTIEMKHQGVKQSRSEMLPQVALMAENNFSGPITIEVPAIDKNFNYWYVGVGVKYNIASLFKSNRKVRKAKAELQQARDEHALVREQTDMTINSEYTDFLTSFKELRTQQKTVELATQNYDVTDNRYRNGLALLTDMLDASNVRIDAELGLVNARINVLYHHYKMKYVTNSL